MNDDGVELEGAARRFHTLRSLGLQSWADVDASHLRGIEASCRDYFRGNPYGRWFDVLERIVSGAGASYYGKGIPACHLDLIPYATECKWTELTSGERTILLRIAGDSLGLLLEQSDISLLILNGRTVVDHFRQVTGQQLESSEMLGWELPRNSGRPVAGLSYYGTIDCIGGYALDRQVTVLGFNHNLQSSFGVTSGVLSAIRHWVADEAARSGL